MSGRRLFYGVWCAIGAAAGLLVAFGMLIAYWILIASVARGHGIYEHWHSPDNPGLSCCHGEDCKPARAYIHEDGLWRAWDGQRWLTVPSGKLLPVDLAGDGRSHLCSRGDFVLCFSPGPPRS